MAAAEKLARSSSGYFYHQRPVHRIRSRPTSGLIATVPRRKSRHSRDVVLPRATEGRKTQSRIPQEQGLGPIRRLGENSDQAGRTRFGAFWKPADPALISLPRPAWPAHDEPALVDGQNPVLLPGRFVVAGSRSGLVQAPTLPVRLRGRIDDKGCDRQVIGTPGPTCEGRHHRGILEHLLQGVPAMRLEGKVAVIVGAGQSPGEGIGNGRATTLRFAQ